jgi:hypothetical protein
MRKIIFTVSIILFSLSIKAQTQVVNAKKDKNSTISSISYSLPKNVLQIRFVIKHDIYKAGKFADSTSKYFGKEADIKADKDEWSIDKTEVNVDAIPDNTQIYNVYAPVSSVACLLSLTPDGILRGVNLDVIKQTIVDSNPNKDKISDAVLTPKTSESSKPTLLSAKTPADAYESLSKLQNERMSMLLQEEDALDGKAVQTYLSEIEKQEKSLYSLFNGDKISTEEQKNISYTPDKEVNDFELCRFNSESGFQKDGTPITISIHRTRSMASSVNESVPTGFIYRQPAYVSVLIKMGSDILYSANLNVAQLGSLNSLPVKFFEKGDKKAEFDTSTGALIQLTK